MRVVLDTEDETRRVRALASRLAKTVWVDATELRVTATTSTENPQGPQRR